VTEVVNLLFHGIGTPPQGIASDAVDYFISTDFFRGVLDEAMKHPETRISFDDGYASDVAIALPALQERGLTASFFPLAGYFGERGYVDAGEVRALAEAGMAIGTHGMRHRSWRDLDDAAAAEEFATARAAISEASGAPVTTAACPFGLYDRTVLSRLRTHGYTRVYTSDRRRAQPNAWLQARYSVVKGDSLQSVRERILAPRPVRERVRNAAAARVKAWR
jgi:peptidoglycan/xylan/chitin deacetylase (PgdA/CDA1 family)